MDTRHRILLVDDDPDLLEMYQEILKQLPQLTVLSVAQLLGDAIRRIHLDQSISAMFVNVER